jgi:hypothetical protein
VSALERSGPCPEELGFHQEATALPEQVLALRRQAQAPADPVEQPDTQFGLERQDLTRGRRLAHVQPGPRPGDDKLRDQLLKLKTTTIFGDYAVDERGYQVANRGLFVQWQDGVKVVVWPDQFATARARVPTPPWSRR